MIRIAYVQRIVFSVFLAMCFCNRGGLAWQENQPTTTFTLEMHQDSTAKVLGELFSGSVTGRKRKVFKEVFEISDQQYKRIANEIAKNQVLMVPKVKEFRLVSSEISKLKNQKEKNEEDIKKLRRLKSTLLKIEREFHQSVIRSVTKSLRPIQNRSLKLFVANCATSHFLVMNQRIEFGGSDRLLMWPAWLAESNDLRQSVVRKLNELGKEKEKEVKNELAKFSQRNFPLVQLNSIQKIALKRFRKALKEQVSIRKKNILSQIAFSEEAKVAFELSPKQLSKLKTIQKKMVMTTFVTADKEIKKIGIPQTDKHYQLIEDILTRGQMDVVNSEVAKSCQGIFIHLHPDFEPMVEQYLKSDEEKDLEKRYARILARRSSIQEKKQQLRSKAIEEILKTMEKKWQSPFRQMIGRPQPRIVDSIFDKFSFEERFDPSFQPAPLSFIPNVGVKKFKKTEN